MMKGLCLSLASSAPISLSALPQCIWTLSSSCPVIKPQLWDQLSRAKWYVSSYIQSTHIRTQMRRNMTGLLGGKKDGGESVEKSHCDLWPWAKLNTVTRTETAVGLLDWFKVFMEKLRLDVRWQSSHLHTHAEPWSDKSRSVSGANVKSDEVYRGLWLWYIHKYLYVAIRLCPGVYHTTSRYRSMKQYTTPSCQTVTFTWRFVVRGLWPREWAVWEYILGEVLTCHYMGSTVSHTSICPIHL